MMHQSYSEEYARKLISPREAANLVESGDRLHLGGAANIATIIDKYLAQRKNELSDVYVQTYIDTSEHAILSDDTCYEAFQWNSAFLLGPVRHKSKELGIGVYIPEAWHSAPDLYRSKARYEKFYMVTAPMDQYGFLNFGLTVGHTKAITDVADTVVAVVRPDMPYVYGGFEESIHISNVDYIVEDNEFSTFALPSIEPTQEDKQIAYNICNSDLIEDESTIQVGIGAMPNILLQYIKECDLKHCGLHTEMLTEKMVDLIEAGVVDNSKKSFDKGKSVFTFCLGSRELYDFVHKNPLFASYPVNYTNHPAVLAQQHKLFSLNSAAQIDLTGQVASEQICTSSTPVQISGTGGQLDFVMGTCLSHDKRGKSVLALYSTYKDTSRIVPLLGTGTNVTIPRSLTQYVATEWGVVNLKGLSNTDRAHALISIAHPNFRDSLYRDAYEKKIMSYGTTLKTRQAIPGLVYHSEYSSLG